MSLDPRIPQLLSRWQAAERKPTPEELCSACPELTPQVTQMIRALHSVGAPAPAMAGGDTEGGRSTIPDERPPVVRNPGLDFPVAAAAEAPSHIGPYRILSALGSGGMGVVYKAEQKHPVKRLVALKLIKLGMDTRHVIARFESERQALGMMDHPNIARVSDAGATDTGRPYFVMEYVPGEPITDYCDKNRLTTEARLQLFLQVCDALQHAHQKGIIHRDLKPGNVLVEYRDGRAVPKVIDFGIAKATSISLTEKTLYTEQGQIIGTPEYASPEQAETSGMDVDTRTDIYSMGVILYELLTGKLPFDPKELRSTGYAAMQRIIREEDPPKPSTRLTRLADGQEVESIAKRRRTEPRTLMRQIRGELDWIILKAMDKDRTRRYETAAALAQDLGRYLRDEPVNAGPPTATYRVGKFIKRHLIGLAASAGIAAALVIGLAVAVYGLYNARAQRDQAEVARTEAERESKRNQAITDYLKQMLVATDPEQARVMNVTLESVLDRSRQLFGDDHAILAAVLSSRASALNSAGQLEESERALREAIAAYKTAHGAEHPTVAAAFTSLGLVQAKRAEFDDAQDSLRQALQIKQRAFGARSREAGEAIEPLIEVLQLQAGRDEAEKARLKSLYADLVGAYRHSLGEEDRRTVEWMCVYGAWLHASGYAAEAEPVLARGVELGRRVLDNRNRALYTAMNALKEVYVSQQKDKDAGRLLMEVDKSAQAIFGARNPLVLQSALQLAEFLLRGDDLSTAESVLRRAIETAGPAVSRGDPVMTDLKSKLLEISQRRKNPDRRWLRDFWLEYLEDRRIQYREDPEKLAPMYNQAAEQLLSWDYARDAQNLYLTLLPLQRAVASPDQRAISNTLLGLGTALLAGGQAAQAEPVLRETVDIRKRVLRDGDWQVAEAEGRLGECLLALGRFDEASPLLREASDVLDGSRFATPQSKLRALQALIDLSEATGRPAEAQELRQKMTASTQPSTTPAR